MVGRKELWNGNRERWRNLFTLDPDQSIVAWAWSNHEKYRQRYASAMADPALSHIRFVRIASNHDLERLSQEIRPHPE